MADVLSALGVQFDAQTERHIKCPFPAHHWATGKTPSLKVYVKRNRFICFGCGAKGSSIDFTMHLMSLDIEAATKLLAEKFGIAGDAASTRMDYVHKLSRKIEAGCETDINKSLAKEVEDKVIELLNAARKRLREDPNTIPSDIRMLEAYADFTFTEFDDNKAEWDKASLFDWAERNEKALAKI
jgi:DNA primase